MTEKCNDCGTELVGICYPCICPKCSPDQYAEYVETMNDLIGDF